MKRMFVFYALLMIVLAGCQTTTALVPALNKSEYFQTRSAGFLMDVEGSDVHSTYYLSLRILKPLAQDGYLEVEFEDPANKENTIVVGNVLKAKQQYVDIRSPEVHGIKKARLYAVVIRLYTDQRKATLLDTHNQSVSAIHSESSIKKLSKN